MAVVCNYHFGVPSWITKVHVCTLSACVCVCDSFCLKTFFGCLSAPFRNASAQIVPNATWGDSSLDWERIQNDTEQISVAVSEA